MDTSCLLQPIVFDKPDRIVHPYAWITHIPFAFWMVRVHRPRLFVELGTHTGNSYSAFAQAIKQEKLPTASFAVDTWQGDEHAGRYNDAVYDEYLRYHDSQFRSFSRLVRSTFDDALPHFDDGVIDLLHIDGLHTYSAVKHDFETWLGKMSERGVVLLHDTNVREMDFGVWKLWEELKQRYPHFSFQHGYGLGVVGVGRSFGPELTWLFAQEEDATAVVVRSFFSALGGAILDNATCNDAAKRDAEEDAAYAELSKQFEAAHQEVMLRRRESDEIESHLDAAHRELTDRRRELEDCRAGLNALQLNFKAARLELAGAHRRAKELEARVDELTPRHRGSGRAGRNLLARLRRRVLARLPSGRPPSEKPPQDVDPLKALFDASWYCTQYPDVVTAGVDPLNHYLQCGGKEGRRPNSVFDSEWYLRNNPDVASGGINPLVHYATSGAAEGRNPAPGFSNFGYLKLHPDVALSGTEPLTHYIHHGIREGRAVVAPGVIVLRDLIAPPPGSERALPAGAAVDVIVPVYRNLADVKRCLSSILSSRNKTPRRIVVVDDCSPEPEVSAYLRECAERREILLLANEKNMGFVWSANRGMLASAANDVILLNSDTEVADGFVDRLMQHAYSDEKIATVTPFSNNATICSWPNIGATGGLPEGFGVGEIDRACAVANAGMRCDVPTGVGFCMLIRRDALEKLGLFDVVAFGKGYGEECDFCQRAIRQGWRNVLAADVFVFHEGEKSFGEGSADRKALAQKVIDERFPNYPHDVARFAADDPLRAGRLRALAALLRASGQPVELQVTHSFGGGTDKFLRGRMERKEALHLVLTPFSTSSGKPMGKLAVSLGQLSVEVSISLENVAEAAEFILSFGVARIGIQHLIGFGPELRLLVQALDLPFDFFVHDYAAICPRLYLMRPGGTYCGEPDAAGCQACLALAPPAAADDIILWREQNAWLLRQAEHVVCPSADVASRLAKYHPGRRYSVVHHEDQAEIRGSANGVRRPADTSRIRVAVLGVLAPHKGSDFVIALAQAAERSNLPMSFVVIGYFAQPPEHVPANLQIFGRYVDRDLGDLIEQRDPHVIFYPSRCPETYSYTLSAGLRSGRPILAPALGAFPERLDGVDRAMLYDPDAELADLLEMIALCAGLPDLRGGFLGTRNIVPAEIAAEAG